MDVLNPVKQEIVSAEQINVKIEEHPIESEPWQYSHCIKFEMELSKTTNKPFVCEQCGKSFITEGDMIKHISIHTGVKTYACKHCGKIFRQQGTLSQHIRTHTGEKPYTCEHCGKSFT